MRLKNLVLINVVPVLSIHLLVVLLKNLGNARELSTLQSEIILFTPIVLLVINYKIESERRGRYFFNNFLFIIISCGVGLAIYFLDLGFTYRDWGPYYPKDFMLEGIGALLYMSSIVQCLVGGLVCSTILFIKNMSAKRNELVKR
ncbi:hypothetical protein [Viridibacillus arvi]|uniref:Uncharacterized protein n=1 Tax=Viridibacillus arvi TaxID=263475 RepID=A0A0M0LLH2_9BACL|nr:hypothetical protein [Viridibacillus arvi]KOO51846.1 hypothetical protein AMD00_05270 [Viridibacillus arvi]